MLLFFRHLSTPLHVYDVDHNYSVWQVTAVDGLDDTAETFLGKVTT
jgi:hypothetical protein